MTSWQKVAWPSRLWLLGRVGAAWATAELSFSGGRGFAVVALLHPAAGVRPVRPRRWTVALGRAVRQQEAAGSEGARAREEREVGRGRMRECQLRERPEIEIIFFSWNGPILSVCGERPKTQELLDVLLFLLLLSAAEGQKPRNYKSCCCSCSFCLLPKAKDVGITWVVVGLCTNAKDPRNYLCLYKAVYYIFLCNVFVVLKDFED